MAEFRTVLEPKVTVVNLTFEKEYKFCVRAKNETHVGPERETDFVEVKEVEGEIYNYIYIYI